MEYNEPLVSIIVPVYNAEQYLERCINSILHQEYQNYELLLIDDGSTDASSTMCDAYAKKDSRIQVFHQKNSGVSASRNYALDICQGKYIQFLDSDDWITSDSTKLFVRCAEKHNCDLVIADFYRVVGERLSQMGDIEEEALLSRQQFASYMMENPADFYYGVLWNKFYRKSIIEKVHLRMDPDISWCEDFLFNLEYIRQADTFYALQAPVYYYFKRKGSLVGQNGTSINATIKMKLNVFDYYNQFYKDIYKEEDYDGIRLQVYRFLLSAAKDNMIPPAYLKGVKKLGNERTCILPNVIRAEGIIADSYRYRKLLERLCETVAVKNNLSLDEVMLLLYLNQPVYIKNTKELSEFSGYSKRKLFNILQKLAKKELIRMIKPTRGSTTIQILPAANPVLADLEIAQNDFDHIRFRNFADNDWGTYSKLSEKTKKNIQDCLL